MERRRKKNYTNKRASEQKYFKTKKINMDKAGKKIQALKKSHSKKKKKN